jgi:hypothetical protein
MKPGPRPFVAHVRRVDSLSRRASAASRRVRNRPEIVSPDRRGLVIAALRIVAGASSYFRCNKAGKPTPSSGPSIFLKPFRRGCRSRRDRGNSPTDCPVSAVQVKGRRRSTPPRQSAPKTLGFCSFRIPPDRKGVISHVRRSESMCPVGQPFFHLPSSGFLF